MTKAVESGMPKLRIEECAAQKQARIDRGEDVIVGVNKYRLDKETGRRARHRQHHGARGADRAARRSPRDPRRRRRSSGARRAHRSAARPGNGNLLDLAVEAARRAPPSARSPTRWRRSGAATAPRPVHLRRVRRRLRGRRDWPELQARDRRLRRGRGSAPAHPRGQDGPGRPRPRRQGDRHRASPTSASTSTSARSSRPRTRPRARPSRTTCHVVGVSTQAAGHKTLVPVLIDELKRRRAPTTSSWCRRRHPGAGLRDARRRRRGGHLRPRDPIPAAAREVLARVSEAPPPPDVSACAPDQDCCRRRPAAGATACGRRRARWRGDHAGRVHPARPPRAGRAAPRGAACRSPATPPGSASPALRAWASPPSSRPWGLRLIDSGPPRRRARRRPVEPVPAAPSSATRRAWSSSRRGPERLHPALPRRRPPRRRRAPHPRGDAPVRGRRLRRRLVETVGVGQSEVAVADMVDLRPARRSRSPATSCRASSGGSWSSPTSCINKADGDPKAAQFANHQFENALGLLRSTSAHWRPPVLTLSARPAGHRGFLERDRAPSQDPAGERRTGAETPAPGRQLDVDPDRRRAAQPLQAPRRREAGPGKSQSLRDGGQHDSGCGGASPARPFAG